MEKRKWLRRFVATLTVSAILFCPLPITRATKERAATKAVAALVNASSVIHVPQSGLPWGPIDPLPDAAWFDYDSVVFRNETQLDLNSAVQRHELNTFTDADRQELDDDMNKWYDQHRLIVITNNGAWEDSEPGLRIHYHFGSLGGQGLQLKIYRCILGTFVFYDHEWSS